MASAIKDGRPDAAPKAIGAAHLVRSAPVAAAARPAEGAAPGVAPQATGGPPVVVLLRPLGPLDRGVRIANRLFAAGVPMRQAQNAVKQMMESGRAVCLVAGSEDHGTLAADLAAVNVEARRRVSRDADGVEVAAMRGRLGLSQREYSDLLGFDMRTLQNWEQGRNPPDPAAVVLMRMLDRAPEDAEAMLTEILG